MTPKTARFIPAVLLAALVTSVAGCDPMAKPPAGRADPLPAEQYGRIQASGELHKYLLFDRPILTRPDGDQVMEVEIPVRSREKAYPINVQYRFEFYDAQNRLLTRDERWVFARLDPTLQYRFKGAGTHPAATDWRLIVKPAD